jgi:hypothetical protein
LKKSRIKEPLPLDAFYDFSSTFINEDLKGGLEKLDPYAPAD